MKEEQLKSENYLPTQLQLSGGVEGGVDCAEIGVTYIVFRRAKIHGVKDIEGLSPDLDSAPFTPEGELPEDGSI
jgi:hypothetical protein